MMTESALRQCWANLPSAIRDNGKRCQKRVDRHDPLGLCPQCKRRMQDDSQVNEPSRRVHTDRPNTPQGRRWAQEAGLI